MFCRIVSIDYIRVDIDRGREVNGWDKVLGEEHSRAANHIGASQVKLKNYRISIRQMLAYLIRTGDR